MNSHDASQKPKERLLCPGCKKLLSRTQFFAHKRNKCQEGSTFYEASTMQPRRVCCPGCERKFSSKEPMVVHYSTEHCSITINELSLDLSIMSPEDFLDELKADTGVGFVERGSSTDTRLYVCAEMEGGSDNSSSQRPHGQVSCVAFVRCTLKRCGKMAVRYCNDHSHPTPVVPSTALHRLRTLQDQLSPQQPSPLPIAPQPHQSLIMPKDEHQPESLESSNHSFSNHGTSTFQQKIPNQEYSYFNSEKDYNAERTPIDIEQYDESLEPCTSYAEDHSVYSPEPEEIPPIHQEILNTIKRNLERLENTYHRFVSDSGRDLNEMLHFSTSLYLAADKCPRKPSRKRPAPSALNEVHEESLKTEDSEM